MEKVCSRCSVLKALDQFNKVSAAKDGKASACRDCMKAVKAAAYQRDREKIRAAQIKYKAENREKVLQSQRDTYRRHKDKQNAATRARYYANREEILAKWKADRAQNIEEWKKKERETYRRNAAKRIESQKAYYLANREKLLQYSNDYQKRRIAQDPLYALSRMCRRRITIALSAQGYLKTSPTREMLGCDYEQLAAHLEAQFTEGMTWENRGAKGWHIDHIIPLASATTEEEMLKLCHYTNLQPLWAADNLAKGARV